MAVKQEEKEKKKKYMWGRVAGWAKRIKFNVREAID